MKKVSPKTHTANQYMLKFLSLKFSHPDLLTLKSEIHILILIIMFLSFATFQPNLPTSQRQEAALRNLRSIMARRPQQARLDHQAAKRKKLEISQHAADSSTRRRPHHKHHEMKSMTTRAAKGMQSREHGQCPLFRLAALLCRNSRRAGR